MEEMCKEAANMICWYSNQFSADFPQVLIINDNYF